MKFPQKKNSINENIIYRSSSPEVFWKCALDLQENTHAEMCLNKATLLKSHFGMGVLL